MADAGLLLAGVDVGGTGIKGAAVDLDGGGLATDRVKIATPQPATPESVFEVIERVVRDTHTDGTAVGVTIPGIVRHGVVYSAANIDKSWIGTDADAALEARLKRPVRVVNDADAAGYAEVRWGAAKGEHGVVMVTTLGTGIGSAIVYRGVLVPNTELGHLTLHGDAAEKYCANVVREREQLSYREWAERLTEYYRMLERLFSPDLFVVGGGVSKSWPKFGPLIRIDTPMVPAKLGNNAGIVGAALLAHSAETV
ncbi:MAG: ROK family protein [Nocardioidaceae bacterium]